MITHERFNKGWTFKVHNIRDVETCDKIIDVMMESVMTNIHPNIFTTALAEHAGRKAIPSEEVFATVSVYFDHTWSP